MLEMVVNGGKAVLKEIENHDKQFIFAGVLALTRAAQKTRLDVREAMERTFDNPTRFTLNSVYYDPATKINQVARVGLNEWTPKGRGAGIYLEALITGGNRRDKRSEELLRRKGLLPDGYQMVPTDYMKLNKFGNVTPGRMNMILSALNTQFDSAQNSGVSTRSKVRGKYFVAEIDGVKAIWERIGRGRRGIMPLFIFVKKPLYRKIFDFPTITDKSFNRHFGPEYDKALVHALGTAR